MKWKADYAQSADEWQIRRLALLYARAIDRNIPEIMDDIFTEEAILDIAGRPRREGREAMHALPGWAKERWVATLHKVHNQLVTVQGDAAEGETYCTAEHLERDAGGGTTLYSMSIRYDDRFVKLAGKWRFKSRVLTIEWTDVRQVVWQSAK